MAASLICVDIVQSSELVQRLGPIARDFFDAFHRGHQSVIERHRGQVYGANGDGYTAAFPSAVDGLNAAIEILEIIGPGADQEEHDMTPHLRVGLTDIADLALLEEPPSERHRGSNPALFEVAKLQKFCPVGRLAISSTLFGKIGDRRSLFRPATSPDLRALGAHIYLGRQTVPHLGLSRGLPDNRADAVPPVLITSWQRLSEGEFSIADLPSFFDSKVLVILGETSRRVDSNHGSAATSDAVGLIEIFAHLASNPSITASIDTWQESSDQASQSDVLIVGSGICNGFAFVINDLMRPARFVKHEGNVFAEIVALEGTSKLRFGSRANAGRHCAIIATTANPFAPSQRMLWVAGITGRGTQAGLTFVSDVMRNGLTQLRRRGLSRVSSPVTCIVRARIGSGKEDPGSGRISGYDLLWASDAAGRCENLLEHNPGQQ